MTWSWSRGWNQKFQAVGTHVCCELFRRLFRKHNTLWIYIWKYITQGSFIDWRPDSIRVVLRADWASHKDVTLLSLTLYAKVLTKIRKWSNCMSSSGRSTLRTRMSRKCPKRVLGILRFWVYKNVEAITNPRTRQRGSLNFKNRSRKRESDKPTKNSVQVAAIHQKTPSWGKAQKSSVPSMITPGTIASVLDRNSRSRNVLLCYRSFGRW